MKVYVWCLLAALLGTALAWGQERETPRGPAENADGIEVLTRGPVHEAFAETVTFNPEAGVVVPKAAPEAIEEVPPDQKPEGENVAWIPGYWSWDDEREDFLWISGIWRNLPPGRQWVPGYWGESGPEFQWTSGYWADAAASEIEYLAEPPASVETGPNIDAPSPDHLWIPGCWLWRQNRYAWRPGYWSVGQENWVWVPAYYAWTPRGYVFVDGYYDHPVANRGLLFAPVFFSSNVYARRGFSYSPLTVINPAVFGSQLFLRPNYQHYYFGDYYAASYSSAGYYPWFSYNSNSQYHGYDPIYAQQRWQNRGNRAWEQNIQANFKNLRDHEEARPPRTLVAQNARLTSAGDSPQKGVVVAASLASLAKSKDSPLRLQPVNKDERQKLVAHGQAVHEFRQERKTQETKAAVTSAADAAKPSEPARGKLRPSPLVSRPVDQLGKNQAPPKRHEVLKPNLDIEPKPRAQSGPKPGVKVEAKPPTGKPDVPMVKRDTPKRDRADANPTQPTPKPKESPEKPIRKTPRVGEDPPNRTKTPGRDNPPQPKLQPQPQPKPQPQPQPKPQPQSKPQPQPKAEPSAKPPQGNPGAGSAPGGERPKGKGKEK